jgi:hypothetical protein
MSNVRREAGRVARRSGGLPQALAGIFSRSSTKTTKLLSEQSVASRPKSNARTGSQPDPFEVASTWTYQELLDRLRECQSHESRNGQKDELIRCIKTAMNDDNGAPGSATGEDSTLDRLRLEVLFFVEYPDDATHYHPQESMLSRAPAIPEADTYGGDGAEGEYASVDPTGTSKGKGKEI